MERISYVIQAAAGEDENIEWYDVDDGKEDKEGALASFNFFKELPTFPKVRLIIRSVVEKRIR